MEKDSGLKEVILQAKEAKADEHRGLIAKDLELKDWDGYKACCPHHKENTPSFIWNPKNNSYHCFSCNYNYDILNHYIRFYKLSAKKATEKLISEAGIDYIPELSFVKKEDDINKKYPYPNRVSQDRTSVEKYLFSRGISKETLDYFDVTSDKYGNILFNYYNEYDVLNFYKARVSRQVQKGDKKIVGIKPAENKDTPNILGAGSHPTLYGMDKVSPSGTLFLVEGELEVLSLHESGFNNVVSVPFGANNFSWIEYNYEWLSQFDSVKVWMDNDIAGIKARREIIVRLGNNRCRFIDLPVEIDGVPVKDPNDILVNFGKEKLIEISRYEKELPIEGVADLFDAEDFDPETWDGIRTGIEEIDDEIIYKFFFGSIVTVTGTPGSGKSTIVNNFFINEPINAGYSVAVFSGEMPAPVLKNWVSVGLAGREHVKFKQGKGLEKFIRIIEPTAKEKIKNWSYGKIHVIKDDNNSLTSILERAEQLVKVNGDKIIILDNLATMSLGETGESNTFQKQKEMMNTLKAFAFRYNVLIVLVIHPRKPSSGNSAEGAGGFEMSGAGELYNLCHYNFSMRKYNDKEKQGIKKPDGSWKVKPIYHDTCFKVYKNRLMGITGEVPLYFDRLSYRFYTKPTQLWKRMGWDKDNKSPLPNGGADPNTHGNEEAFDE